MVGVFEEGLFDLLGREFRRDWCRSRIGDEQPDDFPAVNRGDVDRSPLGGVVLGAAFRRHQNRLEHTREQYPAGQ